jgi:RNA polymerase sigma factor (TIGR02999 family)
MSSAAPQDVTRWLHQWRKGDRSALDRLAPLIYDELRRIAARHLRRERSDHTLQSTALVHEAWLRLADQNNTSWQDRAHFFAAAARLIREILVDHARKRLRLKRNAGRPALALDESLDVPHEKHIHLDQLDDALTALAAHDESLARIVELRFFAGLSIAETAEVVGVSPATLKREWAVARSWLYRELTRNT